MIVSPWKQEESDIFARTIEYSHPVNAPLAPPMARARREQRYRLYGKHGLSVETDTYVEDVPMADCFICDGADSSGTQGRRTGCGSSRV